MWDLLRAHTGHDIVISKVMDQVGRGFPDSSRDVQPSKTKKSRKINCDKNRVYGTQKKGIQLTDWTQKNQIELVNLKGQPSLI